MPDVMLIYFSINRALALKIKLFLLIGIILSINVKTLAQNSLEGHINQLLKEEKLAGAVWAIVDNNEIKTGAAGLNNVPENKKMKPNDKVNVGSITKSVIATGILKLANDGKLSLDQPVDKYLPNVPFANPWAETNPVLIQHLLDNTAGLADLRLWHIFSTKADPNTPLSTFYDSDPTVLKIYTKPGTVFSYSNMGFTLLGMIIEAVTHHRYEEYIDQNILKPIGMLHSTFHYKSQIGKDIDPELAMGHYDGGTIAPNMPIMVRPAAQFTTTAHEMGFFYNLF